MAVYVDGGEIKYRGMLMCHMAADTHEELLEMASKIGVKRKWIQQEGTCREHFDICKAKRLLAVKAGAVQVSKKDIVRMMLERSNR